MSNQNPNFNANDASTWPPAQSQGFGQPPAQSQGFGQPPAQSQGFGQPPAQTRPQGFDASSWAARYANVSASEGDVPFLKNGSDGQDVQTNVCYILQMATPVRNGQTGKRKEFNKVDFKVIASDNSAGSSAGTTARVMWMDSGYDYLERDTKAFMDGMAGTPTPTIEQIADLMREPSPYVGRMIGCLCATAKNPQYNRYTWRHIYPETQQEIEKHLQAGGAFSPNNVRQLVLG